MHAEGSKRPAGLRGGGFNLIPIFLEGKSFPKIAGFDVGNRDVLKGGSVATPCGWKQRSERPKRALLSLGSYGFRERKTGLKLRK